MGEMPKLQFAGLAGASKPRVGIALQGGGTHGACTWGMLDELLPYFEKNGIPIVGVSGDSAGAMNLAYAMQGYIAGEPGHKAEGASFMLERLWWSVHSMAILARKGASIETMMDFIRQPREAVVELLGHAEDLMTMPAQALQAMEMMGRHPVDHLMNNPFLSKPPLEALVQAHVDFSQFMNPDAPTLVVNTTDKKTGRPRIYLNSEITPKTVAESGYLPRLMLQLLGPNHTSHRTHDHDGGFSLNPPVVPLYQQCPDMTDLIVLRVTPLVHAGAAREGLQTVQGMQNQQLCYLYNAAVEAGLRHVKMASELQMRPLNIHVVSVPPNWPHSIDTQASIAHTRWEFFKTLHDAGQRIAGSWLSGDGQNLGQHSTYNPDYEFFGCAPAQTPALLRPQKVAPG